MSQKRSPIPRDDSLRKKVKSPPKKPKKKFFTRDNVSKIILPSLLLIAIILTPIFFEIFDVRHQKIDDVVEAPVPGNWYDDLFNGGAPTQDIDPDDDNFTDGFMDGFTNGLSDPERELFRVQPTSEKLYWRLETYDTYTMDAWDKDYTTSNITGYSSLPGYSDGEFTVTTDRNYTGGILTSYFPAPYHYLYPEVFSDNYNFNPSSEWLQVTSSLQEDIYDCKIISTQFEPTSGSTTLAYDVSYTLQDNTLIRDSSAGFSELNTHRTTDTELTTRYLQLPTDYSSNAPYTTQIAADLLNASASIYQQVFRNIIWLSNNCTYDLAMLLGLSDEAPSLGEDYVEWFLNRNMGTAAHFAASLSIICRLQNIPSRIVVGFSYGDEMASEFIIRAKHVHSWVEVFIPFSDSEGYWVAFDPSPLIPGLRDEYGANTIGFDTIFYCTNEFFLPPHVYPNPISPPPYFIANPLSTAWSQDPYNPSNWYGPYVSRNQPFNLIAYLALGSDLDFYDYITTGNPSALTFIEGEQVTFIDTTTDTILGTALTNSSGVAQFNQTYDITTASGLHIIAASWLGTQVETINLLTYNPFAIPPSYEASGVIVSGTVNITNVASPIHIGLLNLYQNKTLFAPILDDFFIDYCSLYQLSSISISNKNLI
ncbi:MAG: transglutaminase domain-containing protein [Asgard group archaeon]|nr:transglutaminase domain-containing protein [Asgard group archaeon]